MIDLLAMIVNDMWIFKAGGFLSIGASTSALVHFHYESDEKEQKNCCLNGQVTPELAEIPFLFWHIGSVSIVCNETKKQIGIKQAAIFSFGCGWGQGGV